MTFRYAPDLPLETPEIWTDCDGFHGDRYGNYRTGWMSAQSGTPGLAGNQPVWGKCYTTVDGTIGVILIGVQNTGFLAHVWNGSTWADRCGATAAGGANNASIAQFGNITLVAGNTGAGAGKDVLLFRDATTANNFAAVAGSPTNALIVLITPQDIVLCLGRGDYLYTSGNVGGGNEWASSEIGDYTVWAGGNTDNGQLHQTHGPITAAATLGSDVIAFKRFGVYRGSFQPSSGGTKWKWRLLHSRFGAWGPGAVTNADDVLYFFGDQGFMSFDGSSFRALDGGIRKTLFSTIGDPAGSVPGDVGLGPNARHVQLAYDSLNRRVCIFNFGQEGGASNRASRSPRHFSFNIDSELWGYQSKLRDVASDASDEYTALILGGEVLNGFTNFGWRYNTNIHLYRLTDTTMQAITTEFGPVSVGTNYQPRLRTYWLGRRDGMTRVERFTPNWVNSDGVNSVNLATATLKTVTPYTSTNPYALTGVAQTAVGMETNSGLLRANYIYEARYHAAEIRIDTLSALNGGDFKSTFTLNAD